MERTKFRQPFTPPKRFRGFYLFLTRFLALSDSRVPNRTSFSTTRPLVFRLLLNYFDQFHFVLRHSRSHEGGGIHRAQSIAESPFAKEDAGCLPTFHFLLLLPSHIECSARSIVLSKLSRSANVHDLSSSWKRLFEELSRKLLNLSPFRSRPRTVFSPFSLSLSFIDGLRRCRRSACGNSSSW